MDLVTIQGRHKVAASAAPSLEAWIKRITEIDGKAPGITEVYRSPAEQDRLYAGWAARKPGFNPAYKSTDKRARHIKGLAIDWGFQGRATARRTAAEFGWEFNVDGEEWHAEKVRPSVWDNPVTAAIKKNVEENEMTVMITSNKGQGLCIPGVGYVGFATPDDVRATKVVSGPSMQVLEVSGRMHEAIAAKK